MPGSEAEGAALLDAYLDGRSKDIEETEIGAETSVDPRKDSTLATSSRTSPFSLRETE
jgi:hypothetical protein